MQVLRQLHHDTITEEQFTRTFAINGGGVVWGAQAAQLSSKHSVWWGRSSMRLPAGVVGNQT